MTYDRSLLLCSSNKCITLSIWIFNEQEDEIQQHIFDIYMKKIKITKDNFVKLTSASF